MKLSLVILYMGMAVSSRAFGAHSQTPSIVSLRGAGEFICLLWAPGSIHRVSRNQLKEGGVVAGRIVQAEGTAWLKVLRQEEQSS